MSVNAARKSACATRSGYQPPNCTTSFHGLGRGCFLLSKSRAFQNIGERVIRFVTGVFINVFAGGRPGELPGPRLSPGSRIVDREAIKKRSIVNTREALDHVQVR